MKTLNYFFLGLLLSLFSVPLFAADCPPHFSLNGGSCVLGAISVQPISEGYWSAAMILPDSDAGAALKILYPEIVDSYTSYANLDIGIIWHGGVMEYIIGWYGSGQQVWLTESQFTERVNSPAFQEYLTSFNSGPFYSLPDSSEILSTLVGLASLLLVVLLFVVGIRKGNKTLSRA